MIAFMLRTISYRSSVAGLSTIMPDKGLLTEMFDY